jgi:hypothetical protein
MGILGSTACSTDHKGRNQPISAPLDPKDRKKLAAHA